MRLSGFLRAPKISKHLKICIDWTFWIFWTKFCSNAGMVFYLYSKEKLMLPLLLPLLLPLDSQKTKKVTALEISNMVYKLLLR